MPGELRVVAEHVQLPRGRRRRAQDVALKSRAVHQVPDGRLRAGEVGVGLVVGATHHLEPALVHQPAQVGAVLGPGVPVRLEVVDLGQDELVVGIAAGHLQVRVHQFEPVGLPGPPRRVLGPLARVGALGVPPHRVIVEVADHEHRPAGLGHGELEPHPAPSVYTRAALPLTDNRIAQHDGNLDDSSPGCGERFTTQAVAVDTDSRRRGAPRRGRRAPLAAALRAVRRTGRRTSPKSAASPHLTAGALFWHL